MLDAPFTLRRKRFKTEFLLWKQINCFPFTLRRNFEKQQSPVILDFCPCNTRAGNGCRDAIVFEKLRFKLKCFPFTLKCKAAVSKFLPIKSVFEKLLFRDGLAWTLVLAEEIKLRCQIPRFEERFRNAPFSWRMSVDGRPNRRNKVAFPDSPVWIAFPKCSVFVME